MRILVLSKRQYMGKDLVNDRFGRFREIPLELARLGHDVSGVAVSYRRREEGLTEDADCAANANVRWHCINAFNGFTPRVGNVVRRAVQVADDFKPDLIWAGSDVYVTTFGAWLANRIRTRCVIDLYDNFETFGASKLPGVLALFRRAVRNADGVTCFSSRLANYVIHTYARSKPTTVIESGFRNDLFYPQDQSSCRQRLGLPIAAKIIGTAGALDRSRGIETLFEAFETLSRESGDIYLALAGPRQRRLRIPHGSRIHDFMELPHEEVPRFVNALDVAVVCYRQSAQGEFSFPQKAYEIMACRVPLVAASVGSMNEVLRDYPQSLYEPENAASLAQAIRRQLDSRIVVDVNVPSWADCAKGLETFFEAVLRESSTIATKSVSRCFLGGGGQAF